MEGFSPRLGAHRGFEEALFSTLISVDFLQNLPKFCPEDTRREPKDLWMSLCKSSKNPPFPLSLISRQPKHPKKISPKIFSNFWGAYIRCTSKHRSERKNLQESARRILRWISRGVLRGIPRYIFDESCGTPFSRIFQRGSPLPPQPPLTPASPKPKKCAAPSNYLSRCT